MSHVINSLYGFLRKFILKDLFTKIEQNKKNIKILMLWLWDHKSRKHCFMDHFTMKAYHEDFTAPQGV